MHSIRPAECRADAELNGSDSGTESESSCGGDGGADRRPLRGGTGRSERSAASVQLHHLQRAGGVFKKRNIQSLMISLGLANVYAMRVNLSEAAVPMKAQYGWSNAEQGFVLSAFFWGYVLFQVPGALLAARFGGKPVFGLGVLSTALLTLLLPLCASRLWLLYLVRALMGLAEAVTYPAVNEMYTQWVPCTERSWHVGVTQAGAYLGTAIAFPLAGALIAIDDDGSGSSSGSWPLVFYYFGGAGVVWYVAWQLFAASTPAQRRGISADERTYIEATTREDADRASKVEVEKSAAVPWLALLTHPAAWAIYCVHFSDSFGNYVLLTYLPKYLDEDLGFSIKDAGFISVLPYICKFAVMVAAGAAADRLAPRTSVRAVRLLMQIGENVLAGGLLVAAGWVGDRSVAVALVVASVGFSGLCAAGYQPNYVDVAPHRAAAIFSIGNVVANTGGIVAPIIAAAVLGEDSSGSGSSGSGSHPGPDRWRHVFYITAGIYAFSALVYAAAMRGKPVAALN